jgi:alpha-tubulin suppressor-like RCC1 family protein
VAGDVKFTMLSVGTTHTCGVSSTNGAYCWGSSIHGELGDGERLEKAVPTAVEGNVTFSQVTAGNQHSCGLTTANVLYCWGRNIFGELGDGTTTDRHTPTLVLQ